MEKFTKKPVTIEAIQMPAAGEAPSQELAQLAKDNDWRWDGDVLLIPKQSCHFKAFPRDWIIRTETGYCYPCDPDDFERDYEKAGPKLEWSHKGYDAKATHNNTIYIVSHDSWEHVFWAFEDSDLIGKYPTIEEAKARCERIAAL